LLESYGIGQPVFFRAAAAGAILRLCSACVSALTDIDSRLKARAIVKENELQITVNGMRREVAERTTVADLLARLDVRPQQVAVEVNRDLVPRTRHEAHVLAANDVVEIVTLVGGG
jgi:sulfur carrier protein